jgi:hypothetical protein
MKTQKMAKEKANKWVDEIKSLLDEISPPDGAEFDTICVFYCRETNNFGVYDMTGEAVNKIVYLFDLNPTEPIH